MLMQVFGIKIVCWHVLTRKLQKPGHASVHFFLHMLCHLKSKTCSCSPVKTSFMLSASITFPQVVHLSQGIFDGQSAFRESKEDLPSAQLSWWWYILIRAWLKVDCSYCGAVSDHADCFLHASWKTGTILAFEKNGKWLPGQITTY